MNTDKLIETLTNEEYKDFELLYGEFYWWIKFTLFDLKTITLKLGSSIDHKPGDKIYIMTFLVEIDDDDDTTIDFDKSDKNKIIKALEENNFLSKFMYSHSQVLDKYIIDKSSIDFNFKDLNGETALMKYFKKRSSLRPRDYLDRILLSENIDLDIQNNEGLTALHIAIINFQNNKGPVDDIKFLIANANINIKDISGETPIHKIKEPVYDSTYKDDIYIFLLETLIEQNNFELVSYLISVVPELHKKFRNVFKYVKSLEMVQLLIDTALDNKSSDLWPIAYHKEMIELLNNKEFFELFINNEVNINLKDLNESTPLHFIYNLDIAKFLVDLGCNVNDQDYDGNIPLHNLSENLKAKLSIDSSIESEDDSIPLPRLSDKSLTKYLLELGSNVNIKNNEGLIPFFTNDNIYVLTEMIKHSDNVMLRLDEDLDNNKKSTSLFFTR